MLTVDVNNAQCNNLFINKNDDSTTSQLTLNAGSQLTVCADVVVGSSLGTARAGVLNMTNGGVLKLNGAFILTPILSSFLPGTGTIEYSAAAAQTIAATTYNNLTTGGSLVKTLGGIISLSGNLLIGSGTTLDVSSGNNFPTTVAGDWTNNGVFTQRTGTVTFNGSNQSIKGTTTTAFSTITILNGSIVTGLTFSTASIANINSGGKYIQTTGTSILGSSSKNFAPGSIYELQLASASGFSFSGNTYGNLVINFSGSSGLNTNGVLTTVANDLVIKNTGSSAFRFASSQNPTINIGGNFKIEAGTVEVATTTGVPIINVAGNVEQNGGLLKLSISSTGGQQLNIIGNFSLNGGAFQPMTSSGVPLINLKGDWINNGTNFIPGATTINFNGLALQNLAGNTPTTFNNLSLNNAAGLSLSNVDATVNGAFNFVNGKVSTANKKLILGSTATVSGAGPGKYVNGVFRKFIPSANNYSFVFALGDASNYTPVVIDFSGTTAVGSLDVSTIILGSLPALASGISQTKFINRKWSIVNNGVSGFSSYNATFNFADDDKIGSPNTANFVIRKFNGSDWSATTSGILTLNSSQATGLTSFSEFVIGEPDCNFPDVSNFSISSSGTCAGSAANILVNSPSLANGTYNINYDVSGANLSTNQNSSLAINNGNGYFNTIPLLNSGATNLQVNSISSGNCLVHAPGNTTLIVNTTSTGDTSAIACDSFSWYGVKYFSSSQPTHVFTNSTGCDSIVTLHLTIKNSSSGEQTILTCNSYEWNGSVYTTSGDKIHLFPNGNAAGCDSTAILHLTINQSTSGEETVVACGSYTWNGTIYTTSGDKNHLFPNGNSVGCDSTATLHLTINPLSVGGSVSPGATICSGNTSGLLTLSAHTGSVLRWESSIDNVIWNPISNTAPTYTSAPLSQSTSFRAIVKNGTCTEQASSAALITVTGCNTCAGNLKPVVTSMSLSANSIPVNSSITLNGSFTDNTNGGPYSVDIDWNDGTPHTVLNITGSASTSYNFSSAHTYATSNVYEIKLRITDGCNAISDVVPGTSTWQYLAVYVTGNDFTTMGGWFNAPAGSFTANPGFTGKVNMGNVVRPNHPTNKGELELNINGQNFYVHTISPTSWDYLTISGCCLATFKGSVTINNSGNYKILVLQTDKNANCAGFGGNNRIRVRIWNPLTNEIFFDTQPGDPDNALPLVSLNGGAVQVHKPSCNIAIKNGETSEPESSVHPDQFQVNVIPNPTENFFMINIQTSYSEVVLVKVFDLAGRLVTVLKTKPGLQVRFGGNLKTGIYLAEISQRNRKKIIKLIKQ
jgi:hypothetical protein